MFYYTYRVKFPAQGWFYYGAHATRDLRDGYSGSPKNHRRKWDLYAWEFDILEFHPSWEIAQLVEQRLIKATWRDPQSLNCRNTLPWPREAVIQGNKMSQKARARPCGCTRIETGEKLSFPSVHEMTQKLGLTKRLVEYRLRGKYKNHKGYTDFHYQ